MLHSLFGSYLKYVPHGVYVSSDAASILDTLDPHTCVFWGPRELLYLHATENTVWILFRLNAARKYLSVGPLIELIDLAESARGRR